MSHAQEIFRKVIDYGLYQCESNFNSRDYMCNSINQAMYMNIITREDAQTAITEIERFLSQTNITTMTSALLLCSNEYRTNFINEFYNWDEFISNGGFQSKMNFRKFMDKIKRLFRVQ